MVPQCLHKQIDGCLYPSSFNRTNTKMHNCEFMTSGRQWQKLRLRQREWRNKPRSARAPSSSWDIISSIVKLRRNPHRSLVWHSNIPNGNWTLGHVRLITSESGPNCCELGCTIDYGLMGRRRRWMLKDVKLLSWFFELAARRYRE